MRYLVILVLLFAIMPTENSSTQTATPAHSQSNAAKANPADVQSMDSIMAALYDVISGPAGKKRDWDRFRSLFISGAHLIPTGTRPNGESGMRVLTVEDYVASAAPYLEKEGFYEREVARHTDQFARIAQVFSTYESRHKPEEAPFARGINSIQLMNDGQRWWIVTVFWEPESASTPIPPEFLPHARRQ